MVSTLDKCTGTLMGGAALCNSAAVEWCLPEFGLRNKIWSFPKIGEPQDRPQNAIVLIMGTPKKVPIILGNPHFIMQGDPARVRVTLNLSFSRISRGGVKV